MSWLNWFSSGSKKTNPNASSASVASAMLKSTDAKRSNGGSGASPQSAAQASVQRLEQRRTERNTKRELLFQVVRESMVRVGVLSSAFRFKVLSLDQRGRSFLVMLELSAEFSGEAEKLAEIETMIAQTARHRFDIIVQAVYWRYFSANAANSLPPASAPAPLLGAMHTPISRPAPLFAMDGQASSRPAAHNPTALTRPITSHAASPLPPTSARPAPSSPQQQSHDELSDDEVAAFKKALAAGATQGLMAANQAPDESTKNKPGQANTLDIARNKLLLTGYEDTEMADDDPMPALSGTQYGELR